MPTGYLFSSSKPYNIANIFNLYPTFLFWIKKLNEYSVCTDETSTEGLYRLLLPYFVIVACGHFENVNLASNCKRKI